MTKKMQMFVFNGYSATGKTMCMESLVYGEGSIKPIDNLSNLITCTTRPKRETPVKEIDGKHYNFRTQEEFNSLKLIPNFDKLSFYEIDKICKEEGYDDCIVEETKYVDTTYGVLYSELKKIFNKGHHAVGILDVHGISEMQRIFGKENVHSIFFYRDFQDVKKELLQRNVSKEEVEKRMKNAEKEIKNIAKTDYVIYNTGKTKEEIVEEVRNIILKYI